METLCEYKHYELPNKKQPCSNAAEFRLSALNLRDTGKGQKSFLTQSMLRIAGDMVLLSWNNTLRIGPWMPILGSGLKRDTLIDKILTNKTEFWVKALDSFYWTNFLAVNFFFQLALLVLLLIQKGPLHLLLSLCLSKALGCREVVAFRFVLGLRILGYMWYTKELFGLTGVMGYILCVRVPFFRLSCTADFLQATRHLLYSAQRGGLAYLMTISSLIFLGQYLWQYGTAAADMFFSFYLLCTLVPLLILLLVKMEIGIPVIALLYLKNTYNKTSSIYLEERKRLRHFVVILTIATAIKMLIVFLVLWRLFAFLQHSGLLPLVMQYLKHHISFWESRLVEGFRDSKEES